MVSHVKCGQFKIICYFFIIYLLDNLSAICSSIMLSNCDGGAAALTTALGTGDDDEVTTSAGKKRKHWIKHNVKG